MESAPFARTGRDSARQPIILYRACISIAPMS